MRLQNPAKYKTNRIDLCTMLPARRVLRCETIDCLSADLDEVTETLERRPDLAHVLRPLMELDLLESSWAPPTVYESNGVHIGYALHSTAANMTTDCVQFSHTHRGQDLSV